MGKLLKDIIALKEKLKLANNEIGKLKLAVDDNTEIDEVRE